MIRVVRVRGRLVFHRTRASNHLRLTEKAARTVYQGSIISGLEISSEVRIGTRLMTPSDDKFPTIRKYELFDDFSF
jgi:serine acetyltransferase